VSTSKYHVLVVDDSPMARKMLLKTLKANGHTCEEAEDGAVAVERVRETLVDPGLPQFQVILMDFVMVSGEEKMSG
jgi:CheY-like chemotaxis protein